MDTEEGFWTQTVLHIFQAAGKGKLLRSKLVKRSAKHAAEVLPHKDSEYFKPRVEDFLSKQIAAGLLGVKKGKLRLNGLVTSLPTDLQNDTSKPIPTDEPKATLEFPRKPPKQKSRSVAVKDAQGSVAAAAPGSKKKRKREETSLANAGIGTQASAAGKASKKQKKQAESRLMVPDDLIAGDTEDPALDAPAQLQSAPQNAEGNDAKAAPTTKPAKAKSKKVKASKLGPDTSKEPEAAPPTAKKPPAKKPTPRKKKPATKKATGTAEDDEQAVDLEEKDTVGFNWRDSRKRSDLKHGKFSDQEKQAIIKAAKEYARDKGQSDEDFSWMFKRGKGMGNQSKDHGRAWPTIAAKACPNRSVRSIYAIGAVLLRNLSHHADFPEGKWSKEEDEQILAYVEAYGKKWTAIADELGRMALSVRDRYRELVTRSDDRKVGYWTEDECDRLQQAVNEYLQTKQDVENQQTASLSADDLMEEGASGLPNSPENSRVILDDIDWTWVAQKVGTRARSQCLTKWYRSLSPSMVATGQWGVGDDRRMLKAILVSDAEFFSQIMWDSIVPGRTARQSKRRWALMLKRVPDSSEKTLREQAVYLAEKFVPGLLEKVTRLKKDLIVTT